MGGFWSPEPYYGFQITLKYNEEKVVLDKYTIVEKARTFSVYNWLQWLQYYDAEALEKELEAGGFQIEELLGDVAGSALDRSALEFAVIARRPMT